MIILIDEKRSEFCDCENIVVISELHDIDSISSIVLTIIAVLTQSSLNVLISSLDLIIDLRLKSNEQFTFDFQTFAKDFSDAIDELIISIWNDREE